jgi:hypothetical protein
VKLVADERRSGDLLFHCIAALFRFKEIAKAGINRLTIIKRDDFKAPSAISGRFYAHRFATRFRMRVVEKDNRKLSPRHSRAGGNL